LDLSKGMTRFIASSREALQTSVLTKFLLKPYNQSEVSKTVTA
jgi:hypothetical protein